ncbi:hypothetical protein F5B19DRAFT_378511 [Rostrohypoxylon terebratum]|nr:hypothetical protein F5B19DRAFT_378511 [Rostrohypoxylon terebratum]
MMADDEISSLASTLIATSPQPTTPSSPSPSTTIYDHGQPTAVPNHSNIKVLGSENQTRAVRSPDTRKIRELTFSSHFTLFGKDIEVNFSGLQGRIRTKQESGADFMSSSKIFILIGCTFHYKVNDEPPIQEREASTKITFMAFGVDCVAGSKKEGGKRFSWAECTLRCRKKTIYSTTIDGKSCDYSDLMSLPHARIIEDFITT